MRTDVRHAETTPATHALDPLYATEITSVAAILRKDRELAESTRFVSVSLLEPPKAELLGSVAGAGLDRRAFVVLYDRATSRTIEAVVSLTRSTVESWRELRGVQPSIMLEEFFAAEDLTRADPRWQEAVRKRGVTDFSLAMLDPWATGYSAETEPGRRLIRPLTFIRSGPDDNGYARPVEGLLVVVDLDRMEVVDVQDHGVVPLPPQAGNYMPELMTRPGNRPGFTGLRTDVRPLEITQPEGPSFTVDGREVSWQKWRLRVGFSPREGLVLHTVGYFDRGRLRPVIHRASMSEMYIPYGDPAPTHRFKNVFDEGEYGVGFLLNPLERGCDCLGEIFYFDAVVNDADGDPVTIPNAICMHEEDTGVSWKHTDFRTEKTEVRRSRRLVISCYATVGNYEYGFFWYLYTDGNIEFEVKLTGVISTGAVADGQRPGHGTLVAPGLYGPHHQHFFNVRLDMAVDGHRNSVYEVDSEPLPAGPGNETGNAWHTRKTLLARESDSGRLIDPFKARYWSIANPDVLNETGEPVAYKLMPGENTVPMAGEGTQTWNRAGFAYKHLWVTAYDEAQRYAAGDYPNQNKGGTDGLPAFVAADRPLESTDVVVWYTFCAHHVVRPEDWPVMPTSRVGFHLKPVGFFDGNPALDLPPTAPACHSTPEAGEATNGQVTR
ncbi:primary-amine oxidase [Pseudonocardia acidicola]|uniref:Amine oxidase n=1 Tax=Pseudonocardia acidicola TaxID=2724939 RepID=A0ABX1S940_9PSEU|nr:primary-amine oxidase [Pseudonocardia acidicola]NMH97424.1 primary-amine oxidase [Pseudonocardia acidicola]